MYKHIHWIPRSKNLSQEETKGELLVTIGHLDQKSDLFRPKIFCFCHILWKEQLELGQPEVLFLYCHFPQCVRPGTSHLVIYSLSFPIYKRYFPSNADILWFWMWDIFLAAVKIRTLALAYTIIFQPIIAIPTFNTSHVKLHFITIDMLHYSAFSSGRF